MVFQVVLWVEFFRFNKLLLIQEHMLIELVNYLPLKFSERTKKFLERKCKRKLAFQNVFFLVNDINIIEVWVCVTKKSPAVRISSQSIFELNEEREGNTLLLTRHSSYFCINRQPLLCIGSSKLFYIDFLV